MSVPQCPLCEDYEGDPDSIEAHISASMDETHEGEWGSNYREEIENGESVDVDEPAETVPSTYPTNEMEDGPTEEEEKHDVDGDGYPDDETERVKVQDMVEEVQESSTSEESDGDDESQDDSRSGGGKWIAAAAGVVLVVWLVLRGRSGQQDRVQDQGSDIEIL